VHPSREQESLGSGTVLAFDFGAKRIGVAVGDLTRGIAHPLSTIAFEDNRRRMDAIAALVAEWRPARLIVGVPGGERADAHPLRARIGRFVRRLQARFGIKVVPHPFPDHHAFRAEDFAFGDSDPVVMTEKDAVKCKRIVAGNPQAQFWVFPVSASLDPAFERRLLEKLGGSKAA